MNEDLETLLNAVEVYIEKNPTVTRLCFDNTISLITVSSWTKPSKGRKQLNKRETYLFGRYMKLSPRKTT